MRNLIYDVATSIDGFIAGPGDDISMFPVEGDHVADYLERLARYDTVVMGRRTYEFGYGFGLQPGKRAYPNMDHHIFSQSIDLPGDSEVTVVRDNAIGHLSALKHADGSEIYLCGGGGFAGFLMGHGLIDQLRLKIAPVVVGSGIPLFGGAAQTAGFVPGATTRYSNGVVYAVYDLASRQVP